MVRVEAAEGKAGLYRLRFLEEGAEAEVYIAKEQREKNADFS